eukprot:TRINITY_DN3145_c0_g1_i1.p1 TRINITY_DN3145_c0_g1~~TRINITY_DN3145_c0_g1_i1.p1  ORF type:complete len:404 (+),score=68.59 TRINITY_DN3145_c0_g1_i1:133-1344(+)
MDLRNIDDFYVIGKEIGRGTFSVVKRGKNKQTGVEYAIKCIDKKFIKLHLLQREITIMKQLQHPNILPLVDVFESREFIYLVLVLVTGGELFDQIVQNGNYCEADARNIVTQILSAVSYLHSHGVVHRDLKPENLLCIGSGSKIQIYVADFGLSRAFEGDSQQLSTYCGSPEYVAPEVLACVPYDQAVDLWSVGVITYILLTGFLPFYDKEHTVLFARIQVRPASAHSINSSIAPRPTDRLGITSRTAACTTDLIGCAECRLQLGRLSRGVAASAALCAAPAGEGHEEALLGRPGAQPRVAQGQAAAAAAAEAWPAGGIGIARQQQQRRGRRVVGRHVQLVQHGPQEPLGLVVRLVRQALHPRPQRPPAAAATTAATSTAEEVKQSCVYAAAALTFAPCWSAL